MLRTKLFQSFAALILLFGVLSALFGINFIRGRVVQEAQTRVRLDLSSAWSIYDGALREIETVLQMAAGRKLLLDTIEEGHWEHPELRSHLERIRVQFDLDFMTLVDPDGKVMLRTRPPYNTGDIRAHETMVEAALRGETVRGTTLLSGPELNKEGEGLAEEAFIVLEDTPHARLTTRETEPRGMVMMSAVPLRSGPDFHGVLYGGRLLNRNFDFIDRINSVLYSGEEHEGAPLGTSTIFLHDSRIATTVRLANGNRALGTRVSKEVADRVLDNGKPWIGRAFVVKDWYLSAYEPIFDFRDRIIGMLYVGVLEKPFDEMGASLIKRYIGLTLGITVLSLIVAFYLASRLARPIHRVAEAANELHEGRYPDHVPEIKTSTETGNLIAAFNEMVDSLRQREESLKAVNRSYMETLSFVTHELNTPIAAMMNYIYLLKSEKIGALQERQRKAVGVLDGNVRRLMEMVRHYLNLSRIERGTLQPAVSTLNASEDVVSPLLETFEPLAEEKGMQVESRIADDVQLRADANMTREVFENMVSNAIKYGYEGTTVTLSAEPAGEQVAFTVRNEGEGIPYEEQETLFRKFSRLQGREGAALRKQGTGLGLFISKNIVEAHGGSIEVSSEPGKWAAFTFTLPAAGPAGQDTRNANSDLKEGKEHGVN